MRISYLRFKCLEKKRFAVIYFSKNNNSVHRFLKNMICIRYFSINYSVLPKCDLGKYVNAFKAGSQTSMCK